jgi:predicted nucleic-acid-binding Zn-ribbon protein
MPRAGSNFLSARLSDGKMGKNGSCHLTSSVSAVVVVQNRRYGMSQKSRYPKFKGKYIVSMIGKFKFSVPRWQHWTLLPQQIGDVLQHVRNRCSFVNCLCEKSIPTVQHDLLLWALFSYEAVKHAHCLRCRATAVLNTSTLINGTTLTELLRVCWNGLRYIYIRCNDVIVK